MIDRILLINAPFIDLKRQAVYQRLSMPPDGLLYLSGILRMHGYRVTVMDMILDPMNPQEVEQLLRDTQPDLVGISAITACFPAAHKICALAKELLPGVITVIGGAHTYAPAEELLAEQSIDFAVREDGEAVIIELITALNHPSSFPLSKIGGLIYRDGDQILEPATRPQISNLDVLPLPDRGVIDLMRYSEPFVITGSRGCPGNCIFCVAAIQPYRLRHINKILAEIYELYGEYQMPRMYMADNVLTRIDQLCDFLLKHCPNIQWACSCRVDTVSEDLLVKMCLAGCTTVEFGVESGSQTVLNQLNKNISLNDVRQRVEAAWRAGLQVICTFIVGHHCDTPETMKETLCLIKELGEKYQIKALFSFNTLFPGTYQTHNQEQLKIKVHRMHDQLMDPNIPNINGEWFSSEDLRRLFFDVAEWVDQSFPA
jgi:anaerobic magnesium-protoporphyrin IX monomethyl ester cyclase